MGTFERIFNTLYCLIFKTIYIALIPFTIWGFFTQHNVYQERNSKPSWLEQRLAQQEVMLNKAIKEDNLKESQPVQERIGPPPPQVYKPEGNDFNIPLEELLEGNHGRFL